LFIITQFPIADLRALMPDAMGRLAIPDWNADDPSEYFVRGFGEVYPRNSGTWSGCMGSGHFGTSIVRPDIVALSNTARPIGRSRSALTPGSGAFILTA